MQRSVPQQAEEAVQREWVGTQEGVKVVEEADGYVVWTWSAWAAARVMPEARAMERIVEGIAI